MQNIIRRCQSPVAMGKQCFSMLRPTSQQTKARKSLAVPKILQFQDDPIQPRARSGRGGVFRYRLISLCLSLSRSLSRSLVGSAEPDDAALSS
ncbi:hypothetical protein FKM82_007984 [Ascaphus truei]